MEWNGRYFKWQEKVVPDRCMDKYIYICVWKGDSGNINYYEVEWKSRLPLSAYALTGNFPVVVLLCAHRCCGRLSWSPTEVHQNTISYPSLKIVVLFETDAHKIWVLLQACLSRTPSDLSQKAPQDRAIARVLQPVFGQGYWKVKPSCGWKAGMMKIWQGFSLFLISTF